MDATSTEATSSTSLAGVACPYRRVSFTIVATIRESCSHETRPPTVSITVERGSRCCSFNFSVCGSTVALQVLIISIFCYFLTNDINLMVAPSIPSTSFPPLLWLYLRLERLSDLHFNMRQWASTWSIWLLRWSNQLQVEERDFQQCEH